MILPGLTTRENALKAFVRDMRPCIQERARSDPVQRAIECRFVENLIGRDYPTAFRRSSGAS